MKTNDHYSKRFVSGEVVDSYKSILLLREKSGTFIVVDLRTDTNICGLSFSQAFEAYNSVLKKGGLFLKSGTFSLLKKSGLSLKSAHPYCTFF